MSISNGTINNGGGSGGGDGGGGLARYPTRSAFPPTGNTNLLYLALDTGFIYYWDSVTTTYNSVSGSINNPGNLTETISNVLEINNGNQSLLKNVTLSVKPAGDAQDGSMSMNDYNKLLYSITLNEIHDSDLDVNNEFTLPLYYYDSEVFAVTKSPIIVLPNFLNDPNKSSYDYDGDMVWIGSNFVSTQEVNVVCKTLLSGNLVPIVDPKAGVVLNQTIANNVSIGFRWCDDNIDPNNRTNPVQWKVIDNGR